MSGTKFTKDISPNFLELASLPGISWGSKFSSPTCYQYPPQLAQYPNWIYTRKVPDSSLLQPLTGTDMQKEMSFHLNIFWGAHRKYPQELFFSFFLFCGGSARDPTQGFTPAM